MLSEALQLEGAPVKPPLCTAIVRDRYRAVSPCYGLLAPEGRSVQAVQRHRAAAVHCDAMLVCYGLLAPEGRSVQAVQWHRAAAVHCDAMLVCYGLLAPEGRSVQAVQWYRAAAVHCDADLLRTLQHLKGEPFRRSNGTERLLYTAMLRLEQGALEHLKGDPFRCASPQSNCCAGELRRASEPGYREPR